MKDARMNLLMSQQLLDRINEEAKSYEMPPAVYTRAVLAKLLLGVNRPKGYSPDWLIVDRDNAFALHDTTLEKKASEICNELRKKYENTRDTKICIEVNQFIDQLQIVMSDNIAKRGSLKEFRDFFMSDALNIIPYAKFSVYSMLAEFFFSEDNK